MDIIVDEAAIKIARFELGSWATNAYLVTCRKTGKSLLVDAPAGIYTLIRQFGNSPPEYLFLTHSHTDHIEGLRALRDRINIPVAVHEADELWLPFPPELHLKDGAVYDIGNLKIEVIHTPGHTPGSVCLRTGKYLLAGDTLFPGGPGKTGSKEDFRAIIGSLTGKIFVLPEDTRIYPGHGPETVLKKEKEEFAIFSSHTHDPALHGDVTWLNS